MLAAQSWQMVITDMIIDIPVGCPINTGVCHSSGEGAQSWCVHGACIWAGGKVKTERSTCWDTTLHSAVRSWLSWAALQMANPPHSLPEQKKPSYENHNRHVACFSYLSVFQVVMWKPRKRLHFILIAGTANIRGSHHHRQTLCQVTGPPDTGGREKRSERHQNCPRDPCSECLYFAIQHRSGFLFGHSFFGPQELNLGYKTGKKISD